MNSNRSAKQQRVKRLGVHRNPAEETRHKAGARRGKIDRDRVKINNPEEILLFDLRCRDRIRSGIILERASFLDGQSEGDIPALLGFISERLRGRKGTAAPGSI